MIAPDLRALVEDAPLDELPGLAGRLLEAKLFAELRLKGATRAPVCIDAEGDHNISAREAARRLGVSLPYLYKHANEYPFSRRIGRRVLFSSRGLDAWNRGQRITLTAEQPGLDLPTRRAEG